MAQDDRSAEHDLALHVLGGGQLCSHCGGVAQGNYSVHRDGFGQGPAVPLCDDCGSGAAPTLESIWARISQVEN